MLSANCKKYKVQRFSIKIGLTLVITLHFEKRLTVILFKFTKNKKSFFFQNQSYNIIYMELRPEASNWRMCRGISLLCSD